MTLRTIIPSLIVAGLTTLSAHGQIFFPIGPVRDVSKPTTLPMKEATEAGKVGTTKAANTVKSTTVAVQKEQQTKAQKRMRDANAPATSYETISKNQIREQQLEMAHAIVDKTPTTKHGLPENNTTNIVEMMDALTASNLANEQIRQENENARSQGHVNKARLTTVGAISQEMLFWNAAKAQKNTAANIREARELQEKERRRQVHYADSIQ